MFPEITHTSPTEGIFPKTVGEHGCFLRCFFQALCSFDFKTDVVETKISNLLLKISHVNLDLGDYKDLPYSESFFSSCRTLPLKISLCLSAGIL